MRVSSVSAVDPTTTGIPANERAANDRDRAREDRLRLQEQIRVQPAPSPGTGTQVDKRA